MKEKIEMSVQNGDRFQVKMFTGENYKVDDPSRVTTWDSCLVMFTESGIPQLLPYELMAGIEAI